MASADATPTPDVSSLQVTRQMLDELDALMERMLALPVNDLDEAPPAPRPPAPTVSARLTLLDAPAPDDPPALPMTIPDPAPADLPSPDVPAPAPTAISVQVVPPPVLPQIDALLAEVPDYAAPASSWLLAPVLRVNEAFDRATLALGRPGDWLRTTGRPVLGVTGVVLAAVAVGWFLKDWLGWPL